MKNTLCRCFSGSIVLVGDYYLLTRRFFFLNLIAVLRNIVHISHLLFYYLFKLFFTKISTVTKRAWTPI